MNIFIVRSLFLSAHLPFVLLTEEKVSGPFYGTSLSTKDHNELGRDSDIAVDTNIYPQQHLGA
jgi:hypothetical protein